MNRRDFLKTSAVLVGGITMGSMTVNAKTLNKVSTITRDGDSLIIIPSEYLMDKYNLKLTNIPTVLLNNKTWKNVRTVKLKLKFNDLSDVNEKTIEEMVKNSVGYVNYKVIYVFNVIPTICLNSDTCPCRNGYSTLVRGLPEPMYVG